MDLPRRIIVKRRQAIVASAGAGAFCFSIPGAIIHECEKQAILLVNDIVSNQEIGS